MPAYDKLRILWIDDREGDHPRYQYPEPELPEEYQPYFTIARYPGGGLSSVRNPKEFSDVFRPFWAGVDRSMFPVEIVAMDYVLTKWSPDDIQPRPDTRTEDARFREVAQSSRSAKLRTDPPKGKDGQIVGFEGLLIGIFYASLTCDYPAGLVPMTNYGDLMERVNEVRALHAMSKPLLDIDYSNFGVSGSDRSWRNILSQGLKALRFRIMSLFLNRRITLSLADIVAVKSKPLEAVLTVRSNYGIRRLPVAGLFADLATPEDRKSQAIAWAEQLLLEADNQDSFEAISEAWTIAERHWSRYLNENDLIRQRWTLSELLAKQKQDGNLEDSEEAELTACLEMFGVDVEKDPPITKADRVISICSVDHDDSIKGVITRWASVFVLARLIAHLMLVQAKLNRVSTAMSESCFSNFCARDWLYALMPSPEVPLILPAHHKGRNNPASSGGTLGKKLRRLNATMLQDTGDPNLGNCGLDCEHVFAGKSVDGDSLGLRPVERRLLEAALLDHLDKAIQEDGPLAEFRSRLPVSVQTILGGNGHEPSAQPGQRMVARPTHSGSPTGKSTMRGNQGSGG